MKTWKQDALIFVAAVAVGALVEALAFRAACAVDAWLAAADVDHEWWSMNQVDVDQAEEEA